MSPAEKETFKKLLKEVIAEIQEENHPVEATAIFVNGRHKGCPLTDDDVVFFKRWKKFLDNIFYAVGVAVVLGILSGVGYVIKLGIETWRVAHGGK